MNITVGLFGTCGASKWRDAFMERYTVDGIAFFNPQKDDWKPEDAAIEADHLADDQVILFPITSETYATGSLAEVGFSVLQAIKLNRRRNFVVFIDPNLDAALVKDNAVAAKESLRARAIIAKHLRKLELDNLYIVNSLDDMLEVSLVLVKMEAIRATIQQYNPAGS
jgi:hypothetical protein